MCRVIIFLMTLAVSSWVTGATVDPPGVPLLLLAQAAVSPDEAAAIAARRTGGRVLGVEWGEGVNGPVYQVKVLKKDGSVTRVPIPARGRK